MEREQQRIEGGIDGAEVREHGALLDVVEVQAMTEQVGGLRRRVSR